MARNASVRESERVAAMGKRARRPDAGSRRQRLSANAGRDSQEGRASARGTQGIVRVSARGVDSGRDAPGIFAYFHPTRSYAHAVVGEHATYLRKACSFLCASHVGIELVHDEGFLDPMQRYEMLYREYFQLFCDTHFSDAAGAQADLLPLLKQGLEKCRESIMSPAAEPKRAHAPPLARKRHTAAGPGLPASRAV